MGRFIFFIIGLLCLDVNAQHSNVFLGNSSFNMIEETIFLEENKHTSFKPLIKSDLLNYTDNIYFDSSQSLQFRNRYLDRLFNQHVISFSDSAFRIIASPIVNFSFGNELMEEKKLFNNTRGYLIQGDLGKKFSFSTSFAENQSIFPNYLHDYIEENRIVPGQGYMRIFKEKGFDYAMSSGYISYRPSNMFALQFGHGKHFIGDGYRSLLLSDNSFNYPFLRLQTTFWKLKYTNLYTEFQDIHYFSSNNLANYDQMGFAKKYMSAHYLSLSVSKKLNISLFESVIWRMNHAPGSNGFDVNYLNPIALLRPLEFSINSPDNVLVGLNAKYRLTNKSYIYSQIILDEFSLPNLRENLDFWANKFGYQMGYKIYSFLGVENLTTQIEYNYVRPYTYAHHNPQQNYAHYNQSLTHPLGANFSESLLITRYRIKRFELDAKIIFAKIGMDYDTTEVSYGNDLYMSTGNYGEEEGLSDLGTGRPSDFGIEMYQGNLSDLKSYSFNLAYLINPYTNTKINIGILYREFINEEKQDKTQFITFGIKSDLFNYYYDF